MFGFDVLFMSGNDVTVFRYLKLSWPNSAGSGANVGLSDVRFFVGSAQFPPAMTGTSAPLPYVASAASTYSDGGGTQHPYRAFDDAGTYTEYVEAGNGAGFLKLDCGAGFGISPDRVDIRGRNNNESPAGPIILSGSNDDSVYVTLATLTYSSWTAGVTKSFATGLAGAARAVRSVVVSQATATQTYTVPSGVYLLLFKLWGAGAGQAGGGGNRFGGAGGYLYAEVPVVPGDVITFAAGGRGENATERGNAPQGGTSGSGQGNGGSSVGGGTGGGRTEVYKNGMLVAVAPGGGGGGGSDGSGGGGGAGGGLSGADAPDSNDCFGGKGGTQSAPGAAGASKGGGGAGNPGTGGRGGNGAPGAAGARGGGGGGGGYTGGGGGGYQSGGQSSGGAGAAAYAHPTLTQNAATAIGGGTTPPNTSDPNWINSAGTGAPAGGTAYPGLVVMAAASTI